jgi:SAM-dependent methyltransferase
MLAERFEYTPSPAIAMNNLQLQMKAEVERKLQVGSYHLESLPCCVCDGGHFEPLAAKDRYGFSFSVVICRNCGLIQTNPRMDEKSYDEFYLHEYRKLYCGIEAPSHEFFHSQYEKGRAIFEYLDSVSVLPRLDSGSRLVIEVGCGAGGILKYFADHGYRVKGIDLGDEYVAFGRDKFCLDLLVGRFADLQLNEHPCLIIYSHVLEHLLTPRRELALVHERLAEDGILYLEVPGVKNLLYDYDCDFLKYLQNAHTFHFTLATLRNLLRLSGFQICAGNEVIRSVFRKDYRTPLEYPTSLENDYTAAIEYLRSAEKWRRLWEVRQAGKCAIVAVLKAMLKAIGSYGIAKKTYHRFLLRDL